MEHLTLQSHVAAFSKKTCHSKCMLHGVLGNNTQCTHDLCSQICTENDTLHCFWSTTLIARVITGYNFNDPNWFRTFEFGSATKSSYVICVHSGLLPVVACMQHARTVAWFLKKRQCELAISYSPFFA